MTTASGHDVQALRSAAARMVERLGLAGYDNKSILQVDAWIDSPEFRAEWSHGNHELAGDAGAYLGEAIIKRHGGKWSFLPDGPRVTINRNGQHLIDPFGKVQKRATNGEVDQLLALVNLVEHAASQPKLDATAVKNAAYAALADSVSGRGGVSVGVFLFVVTVVPLAVFIALLFVTDLVYAAIGGVCGIALGVVLLRLVSGGPKAPAFPVRSLAFEAQLSIEPLLARLAERLEALGDRPTAAKLEEVAFYTAQLRELLAIVARRDTSPGRGYVGFDVYGAPDSWRR
ncbi:MAG TPA: hypothetical protein VIV11_18450 [Kofleriaceae bacterium]